MIAYILGVLTGSVGGGLLANARYHGRLAKGFRYLDAVARAGYTVEAEDVITAFGSKRAQRRRQDDTD